MIAIRRVGALLSTMVVCIAVTSYTTHAFHGPSPAWMRPSGDTAQTLRSAGIGNRRCSSSSSSSSHRSSTASDHQQSTVVPPAEAAGDLYPTSRGRAIGIGLSGWLLGLTAATQPGRALDPLRKAQERIRIRAQEEFDNVEALASPEGGKTLQPVLALIPIITLRLQLDEIESDLKDPRRFGDALAILQTQDFQKRDIKRVFNAYSDNIYYVAGSERENQYLQGGATPSSRQTLQYLLRNDVIDNVEALTAEIAYLIRERDEQQAEAGGGDGEKNSAAGREDALDEKDLRVYLDKCKEGFDKYLGMVFQSEIDEATGMARAALSKKKNKQQ